MIKAKPLRPALRSTMCDSGSEERFLPEDSGRTLLCGRHTGSVLFRSYSEKGPTQWIRGQASHTIWKVQTQPSACPWLPLKSVLFVEPLEKLCSCFWWERGDALWWWHTGALWDRKELTWQNSEQFPWNLSTLILIPWSTLGYRKLLYISKASWVTVR